MFPWKSYEGSFLGTGTKRLSADGKGLYPKRFMYRNAKGFSPEGCAQILDPGLQLYWGIYSVSVLLLTSGIFV